MNCTDVAAILDDHALSRLSAADRCALDEHVTGCEPCALAWRAQNALLGLPVPAAASDLLGGVLRAVSSQPARAPRRARSRVVWIGTLLAGGAALAATTAVRLLLDRAADQPVAASAQLEDAHERETAQTPSSQTSAPATHASTADASTVSVEDVQIEYAMMIRTPPAYPREGLGRGLNGDVTVSFTIDDHGNVKNARAVSSSDAMFEEPALAAISRWKYLPRVVAGKRVAVDGVQTVIRFMIEPPPPPKAGTKGAEARTPGPAAPARSAADAPPAEPKPAHPADYETFNRSTAIVWQRTITDDLRGAELELDELRATYDLDDRQSNQVWGFYGYIYTQYGDFGRAIDAYEKAVAIRNFEFPGQWTSLASLYLARHQYDRALKTLLAYKQRTANRMDYEAVAMIEKLRALGVTEETL
jgi:TonB family protein